jgi:hypothetical protein
MNETRGETSRCCGRRVVAVRSQKQQSFNFSSAKATRSGTVTRFLIHLPRMSRYRPSYLLFPVTKVPEVICEKEATQMHENHQSSRQVTKLVGSPIKTRQKTCNAASSMKPRSYSERWRRCVQWWLRSESSRRPARHWRRIE